MDDDFLLMSWITNQRRMTYCNYEKTDSTRRDVLSLTVVGIQSGLFAFLSNQSSHRRRYLKSFKRRRKGNQIYIYIHTVDSMNDKTSESAAVIIKGGGKVMYAEINFLCLRLP